MIHIGIDPGKKGAYAHIAGTKPEVYPWDDVFFVSHLQALQSTKDGLMACVEHVHAMPKQGVTSTFTFGWGAGYIEGVLRALGIPYQLVSPRKWKAEFGLDGSKQKSIEVCRKLFPDIVLKNSEDGKAEALLMAEYARRKWG